MFLYLVLLVIFIAIFFAILVFFIPALFGQVVYRLGSNLESKLYGFRKYRVKISEMQLSLYRTPIHKRPTIVMLHGFSADKDIWVRFARYFTKDYNVVIPDLAGHGETEFSNKWNYGVEAQLKRVVELLDQLGIEKCHIIGNSMGGFFSAHFSILYPERVLSVALVDPAGVKSPVKSDLDNLVKKGVNPFLINNRKEFDQFYNMTMAKPPWLPDIVYAALSRQYQIKKPQLIQMFSDFFNKDVLDEKLDKIEPPVLLLWGEKDRLIHVSSVDVWKKGVKNILVHTWPDIGHMPMFETPKESASVYKAFLEKL